MPIAITEEHRELAASVAGFLRDRHARAAARTLLEADVEGLPTFWPAMAELGWTGLHLGEEHGGSGYGLEELVVVVEQLGAELAPGPFVPTVIASAFLDVAGHPELLGGLADGSRTAAIGLGGDVALGAGLADLFLLVDGDDVVVLDRDAVRVDLPANLDVTRRSGRVTRTGPPITTVPAARSLLVDLARIVLAAEAVGVARACTDDAAEYAKVRQQFGRVIGTFQAVKHHCANMLVATELATAAVWDAARAPAGEQRTYAAAVAAALAGPAADLCANLNIQVHGGIGFTYEHDAHLYLRRATVLESLLAPEAAAAELSDLTRAGVQRIRAIDLPPEAEVIRADVRAFLEGIRDEDLGAQRDALVETGYGMPHWPKPWGRAAGAVEQLVIEQELAAAGVKRPSYGITGWVILTLIQHGDDDQVERWVPSALSQDVIWCQLFSEPDAGSDAAGIKTKGTRVEGGWLVNGQKVWTSGAHVAGMGFATVRTNPDVPKHEGITMMVVDMRAPGVEVRPLKMPSGYAEFNEVFFNDVFVPDDDVVGPVDGGWTVARATLGNESVSIGGGEGLMTLRADAILPLLDAHPERLPGGAAHVGRYAAKLEAVSLMNLRSATRAVAGGGPGPEGNVTKLVLSDLGHEAAAITSALSGSDVAFLDGPGAMAAALVLSHRALSIAGGTSEIKRNQIGERILGLPRDPLLH